MARRYRRRPDLDSPWWWAAALFVVMFYALLFAAWLLWALIALPIAGVAKLAHNAGLAHNMVRGLNWSRSRRG